MELCREAWDNSTRRKVHEKKEKRSDPGPFRKRVETCRDKLFSMDQYYQHNNCDNNLIFIQRINWSLVKVTKTTNHYALLGHQPKNSSGRCHASTFEQSLVIFGD
ncbi:hypothetical protein WN51_12802 [Melipona quadrifasciata]|uniref:Uncharacterized protein n=1 Tax=Melipona quadrifasciata TaxID=166423 RepID=A0A0M9A483_9HYME|nr:hypothetical protein WN51_12802 [Melipona quadrifasciata]